MVPDNIQKEHIKKTPDDIVQLQLIEQYKERVKSDNNEKELYKWELINQFQNVWDIDSNNFAETLKSLDFKNLLHYTNKTLINFIDDYEEQARELFKMLFDENISLNKRIEQFSQDSEELVKEYHPDKGAFQDERTIAVYLTCRYPEKYSFYKYSYYESYAEMLDHDIPKAGERYSDYLLLLNDLIDNYIEEDNELVKLSRSTLSDECYVDQNYKILAQDILYRTLEGDKESEEDFKEVLQNIGFKDSEIFFDYLDQLTSKLHISFDDQRIHYGVRLDQQRLLVTIGSRYSFWVESKYNSNTWGFIHTNKSINADKSGDYSQAPEAYWHQTKDPQFIRKEFSGIVEASKVELNRTNKSGYRKFTNTYFEKAIFDKQYRNQLSLELFDKNYSSDMENFTWVPVHKQLSKKLLHYSDKLEELVEILKDAGVKSLTDKDEDGKRFQLSVIDPFSVYRFMNKYGDDTRMQILNTVAEELGVDKKAEDVNGLPTSNAFAARLFPYKPDRTDELEILWGVFEKVVQGAMTPDMWDNASRLENIGPANFSQALFAANPDDYLPIDQHTIPYLNQVMDINPNFEDGEGYLKLMDKIREATDKPFYQISIDAYNWHTRGDNGAEPKVKDEGENYTHSISPNFPLNQILYGPPGTGKTYALRTEYAPHFTQENKLKTKKEYEGEIIESMSWWEVVAMVLLDEGDLTVPEIKDHRFTKIKENISNTKSLHATLWGQLQTHTSPESKNVNTSNRQEPFIFEKKEDSVWTINMENCRQKTPYLLEHLDKMENYTSELNERENYRFTTFHQSFTYEDFVEGIKPVLHEESDETNDGELGYRIEKGIFYQAADEACKLAGFLGLQDCLNHTDEKRKSNFSEATPFALFIDEINRGNISAILGELITLIEQDKRLTKENELIVRLPYSKSKFAVPPNLYILGTLNTADRSVEALDTALRRRFSFEEIEPKPELLAGVIVEDIDIQKMLDQINLRIEKLLDRDHRIGHSYFLPLKKNPTLDQLKLIFADRIIPLLKEYFFGDFGKIGLVLGTSFIGEVQSDGAAIFAEFPGYEDVAAEYDERKVFKISSTENWDFKSIYILKTDVE